VSVSFDPGFLVVIIAPPSPLPALTRSAVEKKKNAAGSVPAALGSSPAPRAGRPPVAPCR